MIKNLEIYNDLQKYTKIVIVVDMVNGFVKEGVLHDKEIMKIIPRQRELLDEFDDENAVEFIRFGNTLHCVKGTSEAEVVDELKGYENMENTISIEKNSTSFMEAPDFREIIGKLTNLKEVHVMGCCTDICDFNGPMALANYFDQWNRNVDIYMHQDAVATYNEKNRQQYVDAAYLLMEQQGIKLVRKK